MPIYNHPLYLNDINQLSASAREICNCHPLGYWGSIINGPRGRGKSGFCLHTQREVYQYKLGISYDDAWEITLKNILFTLEEIDDMFKILDTIKEDTIVLDWQKENTILCKIWDDAGLHGGKYKYFVDTQIVEHLQGNMDVIRLILTGFLINCPEISNLLNFLRAYKDHKIIKIAYTSEGKHPYNRIAQIKMWKEDRMGRWHLYTVGSTKFSCFIDNWVYEEFTRMKTKAIIENRKRFLEMRKKIVTMEPNKPIEEIDAEIGFNEEEFENDAPGGV